MLTFRLFQKKTRCAIAPTESGAQSLLEQGYVEISHEQAAASWPARTLALLQLLIDTDRRMPPGR